MNEFIKFIESKNVKKTELYSLLKINLEEAKILQYITKEYVLGNDSLMVLEILSNFYDIEKYEHLDKIEIIKSLLELGWIVQSSVYTNVKLSDISKLELLNSAVTLSSTFFKIVEEGSLDIALPC